MPTTVKDAIKAFEEANGVKAADAVKVVLLGQIPPIEKMDSSLSALKSCQHLSLSTNNIDKITSLSGMESLKILSLARNQIKKIENLDAVADTLEELWMSYNHVEKLVNIEKLTKLRVLFLSNNKIESWAEVDRLQALPNLEELLLMGNPIYEKAVKESGGGKDHPLTSGSTWRLEILKRLPKLKKVDGIPVDADELEASGAGG